MSIIYIILSKVNSGLMKRILSLLLVVLWMILIYYLSSKTAELSNESSLMLSKYITFVIKRIIPININEYMINNFIRKSAHVFLYFILSILVSNALKYKDKWIIYTTIICLMYAISDEIHQYFVPGRGPHIIDVLIDSIGVLLGIKLYSILIKYKIKSM